ncbi:hypothetical protein [Paenibacillus marinisediminis]
MFIIVIIIVAVVGFTIYNSKMSTSFNEVAQKYINDQEIHLFIQKFKIDDKGAQNQNITVDDKDEIEEIFKLYSGIKLIKTSASKFTTEHTAIQLNIGENSNLLFGLTVTDRGGVSTFDFKTSKLSYYKITNEFDFKSIERLFENIKD